MDMPHGHEVAPIPDTGRSTANTAKAEVVTANAVTLEAVAKFRVEGHQFSRLA